MALIADLSTETATDLKDKINEILVEMKNRGSWRIHKEYAYESDCIAIIERKTWNLYR